MLAAYSFCVVSCLSRWSYAFDPESDSGAIALSSRVTDHADKSSWVVVDWKILEAVILTADLKIDAASTLGWVDVTL